MEMQVSGYWPEIAGAVSAVAVFFAGSAVIEHRRIRKRRENLKNRLRRG